MQSGKWPTFWRNITVSMFRIAELSHVSSKYGTLTLHASEDEGNAFL
jgi:hypothetical protein